MGIELSPEQHKVLEETRAVDTPAAFQALLAGAKKEIDRVVREVMAPNQAIGDTVTELRDLYLSTTTYVDKLATSKYGPERRKLFANAIRLLDTARTWVGEGTRAGAFRVRPVAEIVAASRPWRARLEAFANQTFVFEPETAELFADVNSSGTIEEEVDDLRMLLGHTNQHRARLEEFGMTNDFLAHGEGLLREAEGRDLVGVLGLRNQEEALLLRNRVLTYAVQLGREARAAGINACWDEPEARRRFEAASFRDALRRLRPKRRGGKDEPDAGGEAPAETDGAAGQGGSNSISAR
jgi:hypothetical protein